MSERVFAVVTIANVSGIVNPGGLSVLGAARQSLDGSKVILDFNHHRATIDSLFVAGTDVDAVIAECEMLTHAQAKALVEGSEWTDSEIELPQ